MTSWMVSINDGLAQSFETLTGVYCDAAVAAFAMLPFEESGEPAVVEIWVPELVAAGYAPMLFRMGHDEFGRRVVTHVARAIHPVTDALMHGDVQGWTGGLLG